jgi:transposase
MTATQTDCTGNGTLLIGIELGWSKWMLAFGTEGRRKIRRRIVVARDLAAFEQEVRTAKKKLGLAEDAPVVSCFEAGRDGFWIHRYLCSLGVRNLVVDSSSIEVNRRYRRAKNDGLDGGKLVTMLMRHERGEREMWRVVKAPTAETEADRQLHRELGVLKAERTRHTTRIKSLLATQGVKLEVTGKLREELATAQLWDGSGLPTTMQERLGRELDRLELVQRQIMELVRQRRQLIRDAPTAATAKVRQLMSLRGIGANSAWLWVMEFFGWREFRNRRELGALAGLAPTPYDSGASSKELGISKAGNRRVRAMAIEIAWLWLRYQPQSELSRWFQRRFGSGGGRTRRIGIVAMARKLLVQLWKYLETGEVPPGAVVRQVPAA